MRDSGGYVPAHCGEVGVDERERMGKHRRVDERAQADKCGRVDAGCEGVQPQAFAQPSRIAQSGLLAAPSEQYMECRFVWYSLAWTVYPSGGDGGGAGCTG